MADDDLASKTPVYTNVYGYADASWGDLLTSYKGHTITYDAIGNPLTYYGRTAYTFTWKNGRQLATATANGKTLSFTYNADGIRTSKTVNGVTHTYSLDGDQIIAEEWGNQLLVYFYDDAGLPMGMMYRNSSYADNQFDYYLYEKDVFGNVIAIYNEAGTKVASYCYDAWGNCSVMSNTNGIGTMNPFRYRGYYLDTETNLYYLQSRYYDSYVGRFINADDVGNLGIGDELLSYNLFAYCSNNPVMGYDPTGEWTFSTGFNFSVFLFAGCSYSVFLSIDSRGNVALQTSQADVNARGVIMGVAAIGGNCFISMTNYDTVNQLEGVSASVGGGGKNGLGAELLFENVNGNLFNNPAGVSLSAGIGAGIDIHVTASETKTVFQANIIETFKKAWNKLCSIFD